MDPSLKNYIVDGSESSVNNTVSKLKFISKIEVGDKVDTNSMTLMKDTWGTSCYRTYKKLIANAESRSNTLAFIRRITGEAFDLASRYLMSQDKFYVDIGIIIVESLQQAKAGIINHKETYKSDALHTSEVETLLTTLDTKLKNFIKQAEDIQKSHRNHRIEPSIVSGESPPLQIPDPESLMKRGKTLAK